MTTSWQALLQQQTALSTDTSSASTQQYMPLPQLGVIYVRGDDAQSFLQNLLTNDVNALANNQSQLSGFCNAKGRLSAIFQLIRRNDYYQLLLPKTMTAALQQRLSMFVLRSKVTITDESEKSVCIGLINPTHESLDTLGLSLNSIISDQYSDRYTSISPLDEISPLIEKLQQQQWSLNSEHVWEQLDIKAGLATIYPQTKEKFTPQQVNLDLVDGVSFNKGCYPGQEVVARLHYLGKPSRRLFIAEIKCPDALTVGDEVSTEAGDIAGHIVRLAGKQSETVQLLVSLKLSELEKTLFIKQAELSIVNTE